MKEITKLIQHMELSGNAEIKEYERVIMLTKIAKAFDAKLNQITRQITELEGKTHALRVLD